MEQKRDLGKGKWIWKEEAVGRDQYVRFFDRFELTEPTATLSVSCDTNYEVYVNGRLAGFGQYADYPYDKVYDSIDITPFCRAGENRISLLVWYYGRETFTNYPSAPGVWFEITERSGNVAAASGKNTLCIQPKDYVSGYGKELTEQVGDSFFYRTSGYDGCNGADFSPTGWQNATEVPNRPVSLRLRPIEKLLCKEFRPAKPILPEERIYDLGEETVGYLGLRFRAEKGCTVTVSWGEHLVKTEEGRPAVPRKIGVRDFSVELEGNGEWFGFSNFLRRIGARYFQISGECSVENVGLFPVEYPVNVLPFDCKNSLRNRIYEVSVHTLRCCMFEHYEDCPWREQSLYNLDSRNQMLFGYHAFGEYRFPRASLELYGKDHREDGFLNMCVPSQHDLVIPFFSLFWIVQMEEYASYSGDTSLITAYRSKMTELLKVFLDRIDGGLIPVFDNDVRYWNFYEWNPANKGMCHKLQPYGFDLMLNCAVSLALRSMAKMMKRIGVENAALEDSANALNRKIAERFYDEEEGLFRNRLEEKTFTVLGNSFAILCGAVSGEQAKAVCRNLLNRQDAVPATLSMKCFQYDAMLKCDEDYAAVILDEIDRIYGKMLAEGATSFWETEKGAEDFHNAGSLCHGWSALPIYYYRTLLK